MATKLGKCAYPAGIGPNDLKCYGPPATEDTVFDKAMVADFGCFKQDEVDSNKYYHVAMCTDPSGKWYVYVEYGRQGAGKPQFQFIECGTEQVARKEFVSKCNEKNTSRGQWDTIGGLRLFQPKAGKDMYSVRRLAKRSYGLPDARTIGIVEASANPTPAAKKTGKKTYRCDESVTRLMRDLLGGTISYTRTAIEGGTIPVQSAIVEGRDILTSAKKRISVVGYDLNDQVTDRELRQLTYALYSRIPKVKPLRAPERDWILSQDNIFGWEQDLDAFETALSTNDTNVEIDDPMEGIPATMELIDPRSEIGQYLHQWWPQASRNRHANLSGPLRIKNIWKIERFGDEKTFDTELSKIDSSLKSRNWNQEWRPLHQHKKRTDLSVEQRRRYWDNNVGLLFHGSRSVNIASIIRTNLRLPQQLVGVHITAWMYGQAQYYADDFRKSAGYTSLRKGLYTAGGGAVKGREAFMFACDVALGAPHRATGAHGYTRPPDGCHCVYAEAGYSGVQNNEWMVYQNGRNQLKYLAEFTI